MLYGEYLRKREIFTLYSTGELTDPLSASLSWPACSNEGLVNEELCRGVGVCVICSTRNFRSNFVGESVLNCLSVQNKRLL